MPYALTTLLLKLSTQNIITRFLPQLQLNEISQSEIKFLINAVWLILEEKKIRQAVLFFLKHIIFLDSGL